MATWSDGHRRPLPGTAPPAEGPGFVGRGDVLAELVTALDHSPTLVLIEGEPGIGKTRLLDEIRRSEPISGRTALLAACPPLREPFPLGAVVDGVRRLRNQLDGAELTSLGLSRLCGALRPVFPEWADELPPALEPLDDPKEARHRLLRALSELVERLGVEVLVLEDAHWADTVTLEWLLSLVSAVDGTMSAVITYRPTDVADDSLLLGLTSRTAPGRSRLRVELQPLEVDETRELLASMLGAENVSEEFAAFLRERTDGIPLAVEETVRLLRDRHDIARHKGQWVRRVLDELTVPPTLRDSVLERTARLPEPSGQILEAAAVLGQPADEGLLAAVAGLDESAGASGVAAALASGLLREESRGRFAFRHVLDAQAVTTAIPASRIRTMHSRAAAALQAIKPEPVVQLARHFREAGDNEAWCHYAEAAADLAQKSGGDRTAVMTLLDVFTSIEHPFERQVRLARKLTDAWFNGAEVLDDLAGQVVRVLREVLASSACGPDERGEIRVHLGRALWSTDQEREAFEELEAAVPDLGHRPDLAINAMMSLAMPLLPAWPVARHLYWLNRATELAAAEGSPSDRRVLAQRRATVLLLLGEEAGWEPVEASIEPTTSEIQQRRLARNALNVAKASLFWGRYAESRRRVEASARLIEAAADERSVKDARIARARLDWYTGNWERSRAAVSELLESEDIEKTSMLSARLIAGHLSMAAGARAAAKRHFQAVVDDAAWHDGIDPSYVDAPAALARLYLADNTPDDAAQTVDSAMEMISRKGTWLWATEIAPVATDTLIALGRLDRAEDLVEQFGAGLAGRDAPAPAAALVVCRAMVAEARGDLNLAVSLNAQAAEAWEALPRPYDELQAVERRGVCLVAAGTEDEALELLSETERRFRELGAKWDADRVAHVLRQHGVEVARAWRRGPQGYGEQLSPRELEVLELVARGMTNRQIAEALFISHRTAGQHLSKAMRKLDVGSRAALVAAASKAGLLSTEAQ